MSRKKPAELKTDLRLVARTIDTKSATIVDEAISYIQHLEETTRRQKHQLNAIRGLVQPDTDVEDI